MGPLTKKNFWKLFFRWLWTLIFSLLVFAVAKVYQDKGNITKTQKGTYNLVQTILILVLGLNFFVSNENACTIGICHSCTIGGSQGARRYRAMEYWGLDKM